MNLTNKIALVTGAGRGIGRAITLAYAGAGAEVVLVARTGAELNAVAGEVAGMGRQALVVEADVSEPVDVNRMVEASLARFGRIDILVNNAAVARPKPVVETSLEDWNWMLGINLTGVFLCTRAVLPHMIERGEGNIITISSGSGVRGAPENATYSATKAGIIAFTEALAGEVRELGIRANVICPGPIKTQMLASRPTAGLPPGTSFSQEPEDVAGLALFLASPASGATTAQVFHIRNAARW